ncbi:hypothetical protein ABE205_19650 [Brevibacillus agri]|uniref:hypothetical protein n=1 Tax=Brevibacillus agri TaxID=51101 RepID=UPI003D2087BC
MNIQTSNVRPVSAIQQERQTIEDEKAALQQKVAQLTQDKTMLMLAVTDMYEKNLKLEEKNKNVMLATTEVYELLLTLLPEAEEPEE